MLSPTWPEPHTHTSLHWLTEQLQQSDWPSTEPKLSFWSRDVLSEGFPTIIISLLLTYWPHLKNLTLSFHYNFCYLNSFELLIYLTGIFSFLVKVFFNLWTKHTILHTRRTKIQCRIGGFTFLARLMRFCFIFCWFLD